MHYLFTFITYSLIDPQDLLLSIKHWASHKSTKVNKRIGQSSEWMLLLSSSSKGKGRVKKGSRWDIHQKLTFCWQANRYHLIKTEKKNERDGKFPVWVTAGSFVFLFPVIWNIVDMLGWIRKTRIIPARLDFYWHLLSSIVDFYFYSWCYDPREFLQFC